MKKLLFAAMIAFITVGCSKSESEPEITLNQKEVKLKFDEDFKFTLSSGAGAAWKSSDEFVGVVDNNGNFEAKHIGETIVSVNVNGKDVNAKVIVEPYITDITEPYLSYGATKATVKSFEKRSVIAETSTALLYRGQGSKENEVFYGFENGSLNGSILSFKTYADVAKDLAKFYSERYTYVGDDDNVLYFQSKDKSYALGISVNTTFGLNATYFKTTSTKSASTKTFGLSGIKSNKINEIKINLHN